MNHVQLIKLGLRNLKKKWGIKTTSGKFEKGPRKIYHWLIKFGHSN